MPKANGKYPYEERQRKIWDKLGESTHTEDHVKVEQGEMQPQAKEWKLEEAKNGFSPTELEEVVRLQVGTGHICL